MRSLILSTLALSFSGLGFAGPNAAVFCQKTMGGITTEFEAFDIASAGDARLLSFRGHHPALPEAKRNFFLKDSGDYEPRFVGLTPYTTTLGYENHLGQRPLLRTSGEAEDPIGRVIKVTFRTYQPPSIAFGDKRTGKVTIELQEGPVRTLEFLGCTYEGALIANWDNIWHAAE